ncbi:MAG: hypothetical protein QM604_01495 [Microbacterium sp.]
MSSVRHLALADARTDSWWLCGWLLVRGVGIGAVIIPPMTVAYQELASEDVPHATMLTRIAQQIGASFGVALRSLATDGTPVTRAPRGHQQTRPLPPLAEPRRAPPCDDPATRRRGPAPEAVLVEIIDDLFLLLVAPAGRAAREHAAPGSVPSSEPTTGEAAPSRRSASSYRAST